MSRGARTRAATAARTPGRARDQSRLTLVRARAGEPASQRRRLIDSAIELSARRGYLNVSIADISANAGASSKTFYEVFEDKEDCLLAAYRSAAGELLTPHDLPASAAWPDAARSVLREFLTGAQEKPFAAQLLLVEALAGGQRVREERHRVRGELERRAQAFLGHASPDGSVLDLPTSAMIGAVRSTLSRHLRTRTEDRLPGLAEDLLTWLRSYAVEAPHRRWSTSAASLLPARAVVADDSRAAHPPGPLPRGRHRIPPNVIARSQRARLIQGTAQVIAANGYADTTVSDIVAAGGVSRDVFYAHFENKLSAYLAAQQFATHHVLEACTGAYFAAEHWPERVWNVLDTLISIIVANPALAHLRLVECYAAGPEAIENTEELKRSATIFLEEGCNSAPEMPRLAVHAIAGTIFETIYTDLAAGDLKQLSRRVPQLTYIATAPFVGPEQAIGAVEELRSRAVAESAR